MENWYNDMGNKIEGKEEALKCEISKPNKFWKHKSEVKKIQLYIDGVLKRTFIALKKHEEHRFISNITFNYRNHGGTVELKIKTFVYDNFNEKLIFYYNNNYWTISQLAKKFNKHYTTFYKYLVVKEMKVKDLIISKKWKEIQAN